MAAREENTAPQAVEADNLTSASADKLADSYRRKKKGMRRTAVISITMATVVLSFVTVLSIQLQALLTAGASSGAIPSFFAASGVSSVVAFGAMGLPLPFLFVAFYFWRRSLQAAQSLAKTDDLRAVGPLIDILSLEEGWTGQDVSALIRLLPRLTATDAALLDSRQRAKLCQVLKLDVESNLYKDWKSRFKPADLQNPANKQAVALRIAIMQAFAQVGDTKALAAIKRLANGAATTPARQCLRSAAQECLPVLERRLAELETHGTLLRASAAPRSGDRLLRPVALRPETQSEELVRAADPPAVCSE